MKNLTLIFICIFGTSLVLNAQQKYFHIGTGLGAELGVSNLFLLESRVASLYLGGETNKRALKMSDGKIDFVSVGWYFNASLWKQDLFGLVESEISSASASIGARVNLRLLHMLDYFVKDNNIALEGLDVYGGVNLGPESSFIFDIEDSFDTRFFIAPFFGARYLLTEKLGAFAEVGNTNYSVFNLGLCFGSNRTFSTN